MEGPIAMLRAIGNLLGTQPLEMDGGGSVLDLPVADQRPRRRITVGRALLALGALGAIAAVVTAVVRGRD
jgi:hypothetical protein